MKLHRCGRLLAVGGTIVGGTVMGGIVVGGFVVRQIRLFFGLKQRGPLLQPEAGPLN
jgi:hypothetical protein